MVTVIIEAITPLTAHCPEQDAGVNYTECSRDFCLTPDYDSMVPPLPEDGSPLSLMVHFDITQIIKTDDIEFMVNIYVYLLRTNLVLLYVLL